MRQHRPSRPYAVALGILWGLPLLLATFLHLTLPKHNASGQCDGIGFGCTLPPADAVLFIGLFATPVLFVAGLLACGTIALVQRRRMARGDR